MTACAKKDPQDHRLDAANYAAGGACWTEAAKLAAEKFGMLTPEYREALHAKDPDAALRRVHEQVAALIGAGTSAEAFAKDMRRVNRLLVDSSIQAKHLRADNAMTVEEIGCAPRTVRTAPVQVCFYCLRERDEDHRTCAGCGGTRFSRKERP